MHEAGRAMDIDLSSIGVSLTKFSGKLRKRMAFFLLSVNLIAGCLNPGISIVEEATIKFTNTFERERPVSLSLLTLRWPTAVF